MKTPTITNANGARWDNIAGKTTDSLGQNDNVIIQNTVDIGYITVQDKTREQEFKSTVYIVHNSNQIKSATDNEGDFSSIEDNIYDQTETDKQQQRRDNFMFEVLSEEDKQFVLDRVGLEEYNEMSQNMKEVFLHCK